MSEADVEQWVEEEKVCILSKPSPLSSNDSLETSSTTCGLSEIMLILLGAVEWKLKYVISLSSYYSLKFALIMISVYASCTFRYSSIGRK